MAFSQVGLFLYDPKSSTDDRTSQRLPNIFEDDPKSVAITPLHEHMAVVRARNELLHLLKGRENLKKNIQVQVLDREIHSKTFALF